MFLASIYLLSRAITEAGVEPVGHVQCVRHVGREAVHRGHRGDGAPLHRHPEHGEGCPVLVHGAGTEKPVHGGAAGLLHDPEVQRLGPAGATEAADVAALARR